MYAVNESNEGETLQVCIAFGWMGVGRVGARSKPRNLETAVVRVVSLLILLLDLVRVLYYWLRANKLLKKLIICMF